MSDIKDKFAKSQALKKAMATKRFKIESARRYLDIYDISRFYTYQFNETLDNLKIGESVTLDCFAPHFRTTFKRVK